MLPHRQLSSGNAALESWSTLGIIAGTGAAGLLLQLAGDAPWRAAVPLVLFAALGWAASTRIPAVPAARSHGGLLDSVVPAPELEFVGHMLLQFDDCSSGSIIYTLMPLFGGYMIPIERLAPDNVAQCQLNTQP